MASRTAKIGELIEELNKSCLTCGHFKEQKELCNLYHKRPPARVIAFACPAFEFVPF